MRFEPFVVHTGYLNIISYIFSSEVLYLGDRETDICLPGEIHHSN